jgi:hypothetical protein
VLNYPLAFSSLAASLVLLACGGASSGDGGGGNDAGATLRNDACQALGVATCDRALTCNLTFTDRDLCIHTFVSSCCESAGTCGEKLAADEAEHYAKCTSDVDSAQCAGFGSPPPPSCDGLWGGL